MAGRPESPQGPEISVDDLATSGQDSGGLDEGAGAVHEMNRAYSAMKVATLLNIPGANVEKALISIENKILAQGEGCALQHHELELLHNSAADIRETLYQIVQSRLAGTRLQQTYAIYSGLATPEDSPDFRTMEQQNFPTNRKASTPTQRLPEKLSQPNMCKRVNSKTCKERHAGIKHMRILEKKIRAQQLARFATRTANRRKRKNKLKRSQFV